MGYALAFAGSTVALVASAQMLPILIPPFLAAEFYTVTKLAFKEYKDSPFVTMKQGKYTKVYQSVFRPDLINEMRGLDTREKLGYLQLQTLIGISKFDNKDKKGNPITLRTQSHGVIVKTLKALNEAGYLQNFEEHSVKNKRVILPKLAFSNSEINNKVPIHDMSFQISDKPIDFEDEEFKKMFPMVFSKRGVLASQGYKIMKDDNSEIQIAHAEEECETKKGLMKKFKNRLSAGISQRKQNEFAKEKEVKNITHTSENRNRGR